MSGPPACPNEQWYLHEAILSFGQLAHRIGVNPATVWRWSMKGCNSKNATRIRLEAVRIGGVNYTSKERFHDFVRRLNDDDGAIGASPGSGAVLPPPTSPPWTTQSQRDRDNQAREATRILKARGLID